MKNKKLLQRREGRTDRQIESAKESDFFSPHHPFSFFHLKGEDYHIKDMARYFILPFLLHLSQINLLTALQVKAIWLCYWNKNSLLIKNPGH